MVYNIIVKMRYDILAHGGYKYNSDIRENRADRIICMKAR